MRTCVSLVVLVALVSPALAHPDAHDDAYHAELPNYPAATRLPEGITPIIQPGSAATTGAHATDIRLDEFFLPPGRRGLQFTEKALSLNGKPVRLTGQMVRRCNHVPGQLMLTSRPVTLHEHEMGFADDLPMATVFVIAPTHEGFVLPFARVPLLVEGRLELGSRVEPDGRVSTIRVILDGEPGSYIEPTNAAPSDAHDGHDHEHHPH